MIDAIISFFAKRWKIILGIVAFVWAFAVFGVAFAGFLPVAGTLIFLAALLIWHIPGVVFSWTGLFEFHEFGASPTGAGGYVVMFLFYYSIACILAVPFGRK